METDSIDCLDGLDAAIYYAKELVNIKYGFRERNQADDGAPDFAKNGPPPQRGRITKISNVGLINLIFRKAGVPLPETEKHGIGTVNSYIDVYKERRSLRPYPVGESKYHKDSVQYPVGTLFLREERTKDDAGYIAIKADEHNNLLQSFWVNNIFGLWCPGVNMVYDLEATHDDYLFEYYVLPQDWLKTI